MDHRRGTRRPARPGQDDGGVAPARLGSRTPHPHRRPGSATVRRNSRPAHRRDRPRPGRQNPEQRKAEPARLALFRLTDVHHDQGISSHALRQARSPRLDGMAGPAPGRSRGGDHRRLVVSARAEPRRRRRVRPSTHPGRRVLRHRRNQRHRERSAPHDPQCRRLRRQGRGSRSGERLPYRRLRLGEHDGIVPGVVDVPAVRL